MTRVLVGLATAVLLVPAIAAAQAKPVVAILYFDNNSIGRDARDFDGVGKGVAELLINDMAANPNVRIVERDRIQALLTEHNLTKDGTIDPQTAIRLGKLVGAQYMIHGGFMSNGRGTYVLTARATNVETSAITNPVRIQSTGEDVLAMIAELSTKLNSEMKLPALRVGDAGNQGGAMPASRAMETPAATKSVASVEAKTTAPAETKAAKAPQAKAAPTKAPDRAQPAAKMDIRTAMLYSKALEAEDAGNRTQAVELYRQVVSKFPDYAPAKTKIAKLGG